jgi:MFS family permease
MEAKARMTAIGRSVRTGGQKIARVTRRATHANGAGRSGLGSLMEAGAINGAGDTLVAVAMAGTIFFGLDVNQARSQVALYLLITMAPFALIAPLIGPGLDRMRSARRVAIAGTFLARGLLCWGMAGAVNHGDQVTFLPAAFGTLVLSKAFGVLRSAITPRVLPDQISLVTANARLSFAGLITAAIAAPVGAGLAVLVGSDWVLRLATLIFFCGAIIGMRLPERVETPDAMVPPASLPTASLPTASLPTAGRPEQQDRPAKEGRGSRWRTLLRVGPMVAEAMQANAALRAFSGFLILYLAFRLREQRFDPVSPNVALGLLAAAAGIGGLVGTALGAGMKARAPHLIVLGTLGLTTLIAAAGAVLFGLWAALGVAFVAAFAQSLGKLSLDAVVQQEVAEEVRSSTFALSESLHQLVWVLGGLAGLGMSIIADGQVAFTVVAGALGLSLVALLSRSRRIRRRDLLPRKRSRPTGDESAATPPA